MNKKEVGLFDNAIHNLKKIIWDLKNEREKYHNELNRLKIEHDEEMRQFTNQTMEILNEVNELFESLYNENEEIN